MTDFEKDRNTGNTDQLLILGQFVRRCGFNYLTFKSLEVEQFLIIYPQELYITYYYFIVAASSLLTALERPASQR